MLLLPKLLALGLALGDAGSGGARSAVPRDMIKSALAEIVFSVLLAPVLMLKQTAAVIGILLGGCVSPGAGSARRRRAESWRARWPFLRRARP